MNLIGLWAAMRRKWVKDGSSSPDNKIQFKWKNLLKECLKRMKAVTGLGMD